MPFKTFIDRFSSPIAGPFIASWSCWNWKIVLIVLTSGLTGPEKIKEIEAFYSVWLNLVLPLAFAALYIFGMPWLIIKFGIFENWCKRKTLERDLKETLRTKLVNDLHYNAEYELVRYLSNLLDENRSFLKDMTVNLDSSLNHFIPHQKSNFVHYVNELNKKTEEFTATFKDMESFLRVIVGLEDLKAPRILADELKNTLERLDSSK